MGTVKREIQQGDILNQVTKNVKRYYGHEGIHTTLVVLYKGSSPENTYFVPALPHGKATIDGERICQKVLSAMHKKNQELSSRIDDAGAVNLEGMAVALHGIDSRVATAIIAKSLYAENVISDEKYKDIQKEMNTPATFNILDGKKKSCELV